MLSAEGLVHISRNRSEPEYAETSEEILVRFVRLAAQASETDVTNTVGPGVDSHFVTEVRRLALSAEVKGKGGTAVRHVFFSERIVRMLVDMWQWGEDFRASKFFGSTFLEGFVKVYGGVSGIWIVHDAI